MRTSLVEAFEDALNDCFSGALEAILGRRVRDEVYAVLGTRGIAKTDVSNRFDDVVKVLTEKFGAGSRVIVHKAIVDLYREYSQRVDFSYEGSLRDRLLFLRERVVADHIWPRRYQDADSFFDEKRSRGDESSAVVDGKQAGWSGLYRFKKGVGSDSNRG